MRFLSGAIFAVLVLGQPQTYQPLYKTETVRLKWDKNTEEKIVKAQIVFVKQKEDIHDETKWVLNIEVESGLDAASPEVRLRPSVDSLRDGTYWVFVRQESEFGVWSPWSEPIEVLKTWRPPEPPGGCVILR